MNEIAAYLEIERQKLIRELFGRIPGTPYQLGLLQIRYYVPRIPLFRSFWLHLGLGSHWQAPDMDKTGGGTLIEGIALIISSQAVIVKGVGRLSTHYLAVTFEKLYPNSAGDIPLCAFYIGG